MASQNYEYIFTESAEADIDLTFSYISDTLNNPEAASDLADEAAGPVFMLVYGRTNGSSPPLATA
ncbi:hypothetical protein [Butyrivibrio sp. FCS014]|uniref:hypothetical protein n=1 Tax=Butyrivibrio sp. FCS014 TaxID=1408304 RepID=UPI000464D605|nr:hypothetical protein [Butyrivibrio sp. FCS014]